MPIIEDIEAGEIEGEAFALTLENGGLVIEFNEDYELDEEVMDAGMEVFDAIVAGDISFEVDDEGTLIVNEAE